MQHIYACTLSLDLWTRSTNACWWCGECEKGGERGERARVATLLPSPSPHSFSLRPSLALSHSFCPLLPPLRPSLALPPLLPSPSLALPYPSPPARPADHPEAAAAAAADGRRPRGRGGCCRRRPRRRGAPASRPQPAGRTHAPHPTTRPHPRSPPKYWHCGQRVTSHLVCSMRLR